MSKIHLLFTWLALVGTSSSISVARADDVVPRVEAGLGLRFMPVGSFEWTGRPGDHPSNLNAYPALGGAPFVDCRLNRFFSVGLAPELTLNVIPKANYYEGAIMFASSIRLKAEYPGWHSAVPYVLVAPGYSWLFNFANSSVGDVMSQGFVLGAYGGARMPVTPRHSVFAEVGYMRGFQQGDKVRYAPSYLVFALGWQASL